jgi:hypothetical protein
VGEAAEAAVVVDAAVAVEEAVTMVEVVMAADAMVAIVDSPGSKLTATDSNESVTI